MRTKNSIINISFGIGSQILSMLVNFISRTIFIYFLGVNYLGVNGLFSNILSMLSLAELGVGSAIVYNMYKPLAENDINKLKSLMKLYKRAYNLIGGIIGIVGLAISPFLNIIIKDKPNIPNLTLIYILFLLNSVISYFFVYKSSLIIADQKNYIVTIQTQKFALIQAIIQIIVLFFTKNYILYLSVQIICSFTLNLSLSKKADKLYPFLKDKNVKNLDYKSKKEIFKHVIAMMSHKVGTVVVNGTDNLLISSFIGVFWVGLYSNYVMVIGLINRFASQVFTAITASVGNLNTDRNMEKSYSIYKKILFINFWLYGIFTIILLVLFNPFIEVWVGEDFLLSNKIVFIIILNFHFMGMRESTLLFNNTLGLFWNDRYKPWIEALINLVISIILLRNYGLIGVFLGTLISTVTVPLWVDPYILFKYGFNKKLSLYFKTYLKYMFITIITGAITYYIVDKIEGSGLNILIIKGSVALIIINILFIISSFKTEEFIYFRNLITESIKKIIKK